MKKGFMFFLNLHNYIKIARICLIPSVFFLFFARGALLMGVAAAIVGVLLIISIIRAPSDEEVLKHIGQNRDEFQKRFISEAEIKGYRSMETLHGFGQGKGLRLKRRVNGEYIYSHIVNIGIARKGAEVLLSVGELNLLQKGEGTRNPFTLPINELQYTFEPIPNEGTAVLELVLLPTNTHIAILVEQDYHFRAFLDMLKS